jgi:MoxR-like ATPase
VLGDEINRASPKTQSALLEVMAERQVTIDSIPYLVPRPFIVIATQNPVEQGGTYDLPEAELDRFMMRTTIGYPDHTSEVEIVQNITAGRAVEDLPAVMSTSDLEQMNQIASNVHLAPAVLAYLVTIAAETRTMPELRLGISPRGTIATAKAAQSLAATEGRSFVTVDDLKTVAPYVLPHRMMLRPEAELQGRTAEDLLDQVIASVVVPVQRAAGH